ncbi:unnamed protein product [Rhizoctonia solani]|uniref:G domain-containing protein n=1 Tax=Rhizoctonia solani TaxID=456999 RepID=A0A8H3CVT5_9AGAM|nr:unnamed protein product [Rhizoctonia solani]
MSGETQDTSHRSGSARFQPDSRANKLSPLYILVMGPQGCGKSSFINLVTGRSECTVLAASKLCTKAVRPSKWSKWMNGNEFRFTDTPGFGNEIIEDAKIFELLVESFVPNPRADRHDGPNLPRRVTGLLYIHSEDEPLKNRTSRKTIEMLVKVLGTWFLDRVTILIRSRRKLGKDLSDYMPPKDSPLYPLYCNDVKPWTMSYELDTQSAVQILEPYIEVYPRLVRLAAMDIFSQQAGSNTNWQYDDIPRRLKEFFIADVGPPVIANQPDAQPRLQEQEKELERLKTLLAQKDGEIADLQSAHGIELKSIQEKNEADRADHDFNRQSLCKTIRDRDEEISSLKSNNNSKLNEIEKLKAQLSKLNSEKELEVKEIQEKLHAKEGEISELSLERDSEIKKLHGELQAKDEEFTRFKIDSERRVQESEDKVRAQESEILRFKTKANGAVNKTGNNQGNEIDRLNEEIRRIKAEYGSLRNHVQLQENTEQAEIMTALGDINRLVEELGQSLSERIEKHVGNNSSGKGLQPQDLLGLFGRFGYELASKVKQDPYLLFEYVVQATVCDQLYAHLFKPFHPNIADDERYNTFITEIYTQVVYQEAQSIAGRWRRDAFNSISRSLAFKSQDQSVGEKMHRLITEALSVLLGKIVGILPHELLKEHDKALVKVVAKAEEFNRLLKGSVSILGDFQPIGFPSGESFRPECMSEVNSKPKKGKQPETIVATVGLGLIKSYALGGGRQPEMVILRNAVVFGLPK